MRTRYAICAALAIGVYAVSPAGAAEKPAFEDITEKAGFKFTHHGPRVDERLRNLGPWFTALGAGGSVGDINNDGHLDIYLTNSLKGHDNHLFLNKGDMTFEEKAQEYGVAALNDENAFSMMSLFADFDNDGLKDLLVVRFGKSLMMKNIDGKYFENVPEALSDAPPTRNPVAASAFDYDRDGDLDIYLGSYFPDVDLTNLKDDTNILHESWEGARNGGTNILLENVGNFVFKDRTEESGLGDTGWSLAIGTGDLDKDGWTDLYVANDFGTDKMFRNNGDGTFEDISEKSIGIDTKKGMNSELGDFDNDGYLDIFVTNITEPYLQECNMLWRNNGDLTFTDVSNVLGVCDAKWGWGAKFVDYDNDGFQDIYVMNGFISGGEKDYIDILMPIMLDSEIDLSDTMNWPALGDMSFSGYEKNVLFKNMDGFTFEEVGEANNVGVERDGRGLMVADLDRDGDLDMIALNANQDAIMFENVLEESGNWISIDLEGVVSNRDAIATRVTAYTEDGLYYRESNAGNGFESQSPAIIHIGIGEASVIDELEVVWPSGITQTFESVKANIHYYLKEQSELTEIEQLTDSNEGPDESTRVSKKQEN